MIKNLSKLAIAAAAVAALPGVAHAGTATATGQAVLNVIIFTETALVSLSDPLLAGQYVDPLTYTLTF